jgi:hypothetical protein
MPKTSELHMKLIEPLTKEQHYTTQQWQDMKPLQWEELLPEAQTTTRLPDTKPSLPELPGDQKNNK